MSPPGVPRSPTQAQPWIGHGAHDDIAKDISLRASFYLACLVAISLWNAAEVMLVNYLQLTYRRLRTLYFWCIMASATGVILFAISQIFNIWVIGASFVPAALGVAGWIPMVTGQSLVLYSRLHMLYIDACILRRTLAMIIFNALVLHVTGLVLFMAANSSHPSPFVFPFAVFEKVQVTIFFVQEAILSSMYLWFSRKFLREQVHRMDDTGETNVRAVRGILRTLISINVVVILLDMTVLVLEYLGLYLIQLSVKNAVYSVKLKMELGILSQLKDFDKRTRTTSSALRMRQDQQREHMKSQWEAALRRAFGTTSRSLAKTGPPEQEGASQHTGSPVAVIPLRSHRNCSRRALPARRDNSDFFNVEVIVSSSNVQGCCEVREGDRKELDSAETDDP